MHNEQQPREQDQVPAATPATPEPRKISSRELFSGAREIIIEHGDRLYRMRITQNGKLILTA